MTFSYPRYSGKLTLYLFKLDIFIGGLKQNVIVGGAIFCLSCHSEYCLTLVTLAEYSFQTSCTKNTTPTNNPQKAKVLKKYLTNEICFVVIILKLLFDLGIVL